MNLDALRQKWAPGSTLSDSSFLILDLIGTIRSLSAPGGTSTKVILDHFRKKVVLSKIGLDSYFSISDILGSIENRAAVVTGTRFLWGAVHKHFAVPGT